MRYRPLGTSGLLVSVVGLGCNNFGRRVDLTGTRAVVDAALDEGITLFDTADVYGERGTSEEFLGAALQGRRDRVVLATKFGNQGGDMGYGPAAGAKGSRAYVRRAVECSLRRLRTDWIDLYQLHTPDPVTPIGETIAALHELVVEGKVRYVGHSNLAAWQLADAAHVARELGGTAFVSAQNEWSLLERGIEAELVPAALHFGLGVLPYYPLAQGLLTGKIDRSHPPQPGMRLHERRQFVTDERLDRVEVLAGVADGAGRSLLELAIGVLAALPGCGSVIAGARSPEQVRANAAAGAWEPPEEVLAAVDAVSPPPGGD